MKFKKASLSDLEILVSTRVNVLRSANQLDLSVDMKEVEKSSRLYYQEALASDNHTAFLVYNADDNVIGAGAVSYYQVMPTYHNPSGKKAYIMNMYVAPEHRRKGIATKLLDLLIADSKIRGIDLIMLVASHL